MREGAVLIHEVRDVWPQTLVDGYGMSRHHPFVWLLDRAESSAYRKSDYVVSTLEFVKEHMTAKGLQEEKFRYITNGVVLKDWEHAAKLGEPHQTTLEEARKNGKFIIGYFGGMTALDTLDFYLDAVKKVKISEILFVLVGDGRERVRLEERIAAEKIDNCIMLPRIEKAQIPSLLKLFDCAYMGTEDVPLLRYGISLTKMTDAMIAGIPIIFRTGVENLVSQNKAGILVDTEDPEVLAQSFEDMYRMPAEERLRMGQNGHDAVVVKYTYEHLARKYCKLFPRKKKLHILLVSHYAGSDKMGMSFRPYYLAREWVKMGYKVDVLVANYSHIRAVNPHIEKSFQQENIDGITYHWIKTRTYAGNGVKRAITMFQFVGQILLHAGKLVRSIQPDVIITGSTYVLDTYAGQRIRKLANRYRNRRRA